MKTLPIRTWLLLALVAALVVPQIAVWAALSVVDWAASARLQDDVVGDVKQNVSRWSDPDWQKAIETRLEAAHLDLALEDSSGRFVFSSAPIPLPGVKFEMSLGAKPVSLGGSQVTEPASSSLAGQKVAYAQANVDTLKFLAAPDLASRFLIGIAVPAMSAPLPVNKRDVVAVGGPEMMSLTSVQLQDDRGQVYRMFVWTRVDPTVVRLKSLLVPLSGLTALALTLLAVAWFIGRAILRPLGAMSQAACQIANGDLAFELPDSRVREVAEVGAAFRAMGDALSASLCAQAEMEQERRLFISAIVHDLRTPLFSLRGYLEGLTEGVANTPEKQARYVGVCQEKAAALDRLVSDLFAFAQLEYLEQRPCREPLDVRALLQKMVDGLRPLAEAKGIRTVLDVPGEAVTIEGDAHLLSRAVDNLLDNALRYTPPGGFIRVALWRAEGRAIFSVSDSGPGFAPRDLPQVFNPLFRADASRSRQTGGAGLGLTIARRILLAHGGELIAANAPGGGAELTALLPIGAAQPFSSGEQVQSPPSAVPG